MQPEAQRYTEENTLEPTAAVASIKCGRSHYAKKEKAGN